MNATNDRPPPGHVGNPGLIQEACRLYPGFPITPALLADAAAQSGLALHVKATPETIRLGLAALAAADRANAAKTANERFMAALLAAHGGRPPRNPEGN